jgi:DNA-binding response OmpR family regulator
MIPRAYADPLPPFSAGTRAEASPADARPALIVAVAAGDVDRFPTSPFVRYAARNTTDALRLVERWQPRAVAIDWDLPDFDGASICAAARRVPGAGILVVTSTPESAPAVLKAGCHAVLLKPFAPNLLVARLGRLLRELPSPAIASRLADKLGQFGTNRTWPDVACPKCAREGAVSFEHSSHRRAWYACLACEAVWLGRRQE